MTFADHQLDPRLDLKLERIVDVPRELVWKAWTTPEHLMKWFTPAPWTTVECDIDLRPGGVFRTVICSPEGERHPLAGCYLDIVDNERIVWTDALGPGFRPSNQPNDCIESFFTAIIGLAPHGDGTKYTVVVLHGDEESRRRHEERGFTDGWGTALDQLVACIKDGRISG